MTFHDGLKLFLGIGGTILSLIIYIYGAKKASYAHVVNKPLKGSALLMFLGMFLFFNTGSLLCTYVSQRVEEFLFRFYCGGVYIMCIGAVILSVPPKYTTDENGDFIPNPERKGCLTFLIVGLISGMIFFGYLGYALMGSIAKSKRSAINSNTKSVYNVACTYQVDADVNQELPPLQTHIRKIGSVGDEFDEYLMHYFSDAKGYWCAVVMPENALDAEPEYVLFSDKEITSYEPMTDEEIYLYYRSIFKFGKQAIGHYP